MNKDFEMARRIATAVAGAGGRAYFVGGYVRDRLMNVENKDVDIEIHGIGVGQLEGILDSLGKRTVMGASFGVFGLSHYDIDIAMPRKEKAVGRGHKDFDISVDPFIGPEKACMRRDFTVNAMMCDILTGEILDFYGGMEDLRSKRIRHVCSASFVEDPLRVLRGAQFSARFGFSIADETLALCRTMDLRGLSKERVMEETLKALEKSKRPSVYFRQLRNMNALNSWFPELEALTGIEQDPVRHPEGDCFEHTMRVLDEAACLRDRAEEPVGLMFAALCHDFGKAKTTEIKNGRIHAYGHETAGVEVAECFMKRLTLEKRLIKYVLNMTVMHMRPNRDALCAAKDKSFMRMFDESVCPNDLLLLARADALGCCREGAEREAAAIDYESTASLLTAKLAMYRELMKEPMVTGKDLAEAGIRPGPVYAEALEYARKLHLAGVNKENALKQTLAQLNIRKPC